MKQWDAQAVQKSFAQRALDLSPAGRSSMTCRSRSIAAIGSDWLAPMGLAKGRRMNPQKLRVDPPSLKLQPSHRAPARRDGAIPPNVFGVDAAHKRFGIVFVVARLPPPQRYGAAGINAQTWAMLPKPPTLNYSSINDQLTLNHMLSVAAFSDRGWFKKVLNLAVVKLRLNSSTE
jgi:hypothetical protein